MIGPGHGLNELTNRALATGLSLVHPLESAWELYPGPFGLYARHCDDAIFFNNTTLIDFYNDYVRQDVSPDDSPRNNENIGKFIKLYEDEVLINNYSRLPIVLPIYINTMNIASIVNYAATLPDVTCVSTNIDVSESIMREHHLLMEYSTGAAEDVDYDSEVDLSVMCDQLYSKYCSMQAVMKECDKLSIMVVSANDLLRGDVDALSIIDEEIQLDIVRDTINNYNFVNSKATNPLISQIRDMDWEEIKQIGIRYSDE